jgi:hypothetical protein
MSQKCFEGGASSRTEEAETGSLGKLREGLPEIGIHSFKDWDTIIIPKLEDKLRDGTQDLKSICKTSEEHAYTEGMLKLSRI